MRELKKLPELLLFDLDGTLAKTKEQIAYAAQATLKRFNYPIPSVDDVGRYIGNGINMMLVRSIFGKVDVSPDMLPADQMAKIREVFNEEYLNGLNANFALYDGVYEGINKFKALGMKMAVVTNKAEMFAKPLIGYMGFNDYFDYVLGGEVIKERKPDPFPLLYVCQKLGVDPHNAVMVGDSDNDVLAGQRADMVTVAFTYGYNSGKDVRNCHPDYVFDRFDAFTDFIMSLKNNTESLD